MAAVGHDASMNIAARGREPMGQRRDAVLTRSGDQSPSVVGSWPVTLALAGLAIAVYRLLVLPIAPDGSTDRLVELAFIAAFALTEILVAGVTVLGQDVSLSLREIPLVIGLRILAPAELEIVLAAGVGIALLTYRGLPARSVITGVALAGLGGSIAVIVASSVLALGPQDPATSWVATALAMAAYAAVDVAAHWSLRRMSGVASRSLAIDAAVRLAQAAVGTAVAIAAFVLMRTAPGELWLVVVPAAAGLVAYRKLRVQRDRRGQLERLLERSQQLGQLGLDRVIRGGATVPVLTPTAAGPVLHDPAPAPNALLHGAFGSVQRRGGLWRVVDGLRPAGYELDERLLVEALSSRIDLMIENAALIERLSESMADVTKLASIVQSSEDAIVAVAPDGRATAWNRAAERLFGRRTDEMVGRRVADVVPDAVREVLSGPYEAVLDGAASQHVATDWTRPDGTTIPVSITLMPIRDPADDLAGLAAIVRDESERARADDAVRLGAEQLHAIVAGSPIGMGIADRDLRWTQANPALCAILGTTMDEMYARPITEGIHPDDLSTVAALEDRLFDDDVAPRTVERRYVGADVVTRWASVTARPLMASTPEPPRALVMVEDITDRRRAEDEQRSTEERFRRGVLSMSALEEPAQVLRAVLTSARETVDAAYAAVVCYTADGVEITSSEFDGFRVDRLRDDIGRGPTATGILAFAPQSDRPIRLRDVRTHPSFGGFPPSHPLLTSFLAVPIPFASDERATLYLANKIGAAEFSEADEAISVALAAHAAVCVENARITARSSGLVRDLDRANLQLVKANDAKSQFMATLAHELRTPLHAILVAGDIVREPPAGTLSGDQLRDLGGTVRSSGRLMLRLVDDLVDLARIESGRLELRPASFRLEEVLAAIRPELTRLAAERRITLDMPAMPRIRLDADPIRIQQILTNLVANAIKFTGPEGWISVRAASTRAITRITVEDSGIGIAAADLERAFLPFQQVSGLATTGAGLGLAIARSLAELHDGELIATSIPGVGSHFVLSLPRGRANGRVNGRANAIGRAHASPAVQALGSSSSIPGDAPAISLP